MELSQHPNLWLSNRTLANESLLGTPCAEPSSYLHVIYIQHTSFYAGEIPLYIISFFIRLAAEKSTLQNRRKCGKKSGTSAGLGCESDVHDAPCVQLFNCFIRRRTGTRNNGLMINTQVNIAKKYLNIALKTNDSNTPQEWQSLGSSRLQ